MDTRITIDDMQEIDYHSVEGADRLLTVSELCERLKVSRHYVYGLTHKKAIPHIKMMGRLRFRLGDIDEWLRSQKVEVRIGGTETCDT